MDHYFLGVGGELGNFQKTFPAQEKQLKKSCKGSHGEKLSNGFIIVIFDKLTAQEKNLVQLEVEKNIYIAQKFAQPPPPPLKYIMVRTLLCNVTFVMKYPLFL